jgi:hypothetical protein
VDDVKVRLPIETIPETAAQDQQASILQRIEGEREASPWPLSKSVRLVVVTSARSVERTMWCARVFPP